MYTKFKRLFKRVSSKCSPYCDHFYRHMYIKRRDSHHYDLFCTRHGYMLTVPREIAEDNIEHGALVIGKNDEHPTSATFKDFVKRMEAQTSA